MSNSKAEHDFQYYGKDRTLAVSEEGGTMGSDDRHEFTKTCRNAGIPEAEAWDLLTKLYGLDDINPEDIKVTGVGAAGLSGAAVIFIEYGRDRYLPEQNVVKVGSAGEIWCEYENFQKLNQKLMRAAFIPIKDVFPPPKTPNTSYAALRYADAKSFLGTKRLQSLQEFLSKPKNKDDVLEKFSNILAKITRVIHNLEPKIGRGNYSEFYERYLPKQETRIDRFKEAMSDLESQFTIGGGGKQDPLTASLFLDQFNNPLFHLQEMLNAHSNRIHLRMIHGDLNLQNVVVSEDGTNFGLIDWATVGPDQPVLFDFAKLYVELCNHLLNPLLDAKATKDFEIALYDDLLVESRNPEAVDYRSLIDEDQEWVRRLCLEVIRKATMVCDDVGHYDTFRKEWLWAVCFYALKTICFKNLAEKKEIRSRAFLKAAICCSALQDDWEVPRIEEHRICAPAVAERIGEPLLTRSNSQRRYDEMRQQTNRHFDIAEEILCFIALEQDYPQLTPEEQKEFAAQESMGQKPLSLPQAVENLWQDQSRQSWHCLLLGEGGQGKTTSLLNLWQSLLKNSQKSAPVPVFLSLESYNQVKKEYQRDFIWRQIFSDYLGYFPEEKDIIKFKNQLLEPLRSNEMVLPKVVLMLDGFNEVTTERDDLFLCLKDVQMMEGIQLIVASRYDIRDSHACWDDFAALKLQPLTSEQIREFMKRENQAYPEDLLGDLLRNPMMLTLYCGMKPAMWKSEALKKYDFIEEPRSKTEIMHNFIVSQLIHIDQSALRFESAINRLYFFHLLPKIAYKMVHKGHFRLLYEDLAEIVRQELDHYSTQEFLVQHPEIAIRIQSGSDRRRLRDMDAMDAVYALCKQICFLTELRIDKELSYEFLHQEFRDYFAASALLKELKRNDEQLEQTLLKYTQSYKWDSVLLHVSQMLDRGELLRVLKILQNEDVELGAQMACNSRYQLDKENLQVLVQGLDQKLENATPYRSLYIAHLLGELKVEEACGPLLRYAFHNRGGSQFTTTVNALRKIDISERKPELPWLARIAGLDESTLSQKDTADIYWVSWVKAFLEGSLNEKHSRPTEGDLIDDLLDSYLSEFAIREDEIGMATAIILGKFANRERLTTVVAGQYKSYFDIMAATAYILRYHDDITELFTQLLEEDVYEEVIVYEQLGRYDWGEPLELERYNELVGKRLSTKKLFNRVVVILAYLLGYEVSTDGLDLLFSQLSNGAKIEKPDQKEILERLADLVFAHDPLELRNGIEGVVNRIIKFEPVRLHPRFYDEAERRDFIEKSRNPKIEAYEDHVRVDAVRCLSLFGEEGKKQLQQLARKASWPNCKTIIKQTIDGLSFSMELCLGSPKAFLFWAFKIKNPPEKVVRNAVMIAKEETKIGILKESLENGIIKSEDVAIASFGLKTAGKGVLGKAIGMMSSSDYNHFLELVKQFDQEAAIFLLDVAMENQDINELFCRFLFDVYHVGSWSSLAALLLLAKADSVQIPMRGLGEEKREEAKVDEWYSRSLVERLHGTAPAPSRDFLPLLTQADIMRARQEARNMTDEDFFLLWLLKEYAQESSTRLLAEQVLEEALRSGGGEKQYEPPSGRQEMLEMLVQRFEGKPIHDRDIPRCILSDCGALGESAFHIPETIIMSRINAFDEFKYCPWMKEALRIVGKFGDKALDILQELVNSAWWSYRYHEYVKLIISAVGDVGSASAEQLLLEILERFVRNTSPSDSLWKWMEFVNSCRKIGLPSIRAVLLLERLFGRRHWVITKREDWERKHWVNFVGAVNKLASELRSELLGWQSVLASFFPSTFMRSHKQIRKIWKEAIKVPGPAAHPENWGIKHKIDWDDDYYY